mmetsp:Transcript_98708/g.255212  ORF Transcript_98708/g.255212 Transcript_98708/m.255212 type:complete len:354 (+) Transcript_98708:295-1356(+)
MSCDSEDSAWTCGASHAGLVRLRLGIDHRAQGFWDDVLAGVVILRENDALQAGVDGQAEDVHVQLADHIGEERVDDERHHRRDGAVHRLEDEVAPSSGRCHDEHQPDIVNHAAQHGDGPETQDVRRDDLEGLPGGRAEVRAADCDLDVSVLAQELDTLLEAPDAALQNPEDHHHAAVLLRSRLLLHVLHAIADELHDRDDEGAKGEGACVVAEHVPDRRLDRGLLALPVIGREEPRGDRTGNDALPDGDQEGIVPEVGEERIGEAVVEDVPRRGAAPALRRGGAVALLILPDQAGRPLVGARAGRALAEPGVGIDAVRFGVRLVVPHGRVRVRHLREQEGGREGPSSAPDDAQ